MKKAIKLKNEEILTTKEVANYLKVPLSTLHWLARSKEVPAFKVGRHWRFKRAKIESWIKVQEKRK